MSLLLDYRVFDKKQNSYLDDEELQGFVPLQKQDYEIEFFTGLIDKNQVKVYERDILSVKIINQEQSLILNEAMFEIVSSIRFYRLYEKFDFEIKAFGGLVIDNHRTKPELFMLDEIINYFTSYKELDENQTKDLKTEIEILSNAHTISHKENYLVEFYKSLREEQ